MSKRQIGQQGEAIAAEALVNAGYELLTRNWRCSTGELDLVARHRDDIVFVEVRTRSGSEGIDAAIESITPRKITRLINLAGLYLQSHALENSPFRIDIVAVELPSIGSSGEPSVEIFEDAIGW